MSVFSDIFQYNTISFACSHNSATSTGIVVQVEGGIPPFLKTRSLILSYHGISY